MTRYYRWMVLVTLLTAFAIWIATPLSDGFTLDTDGDGKPDITINEQPLGLDLVGGVRVLLEAALPAGTYTHDDLQRAAENVERRVNGLGLTEATVQVVGNSRILVELPGVTDKQQAVDTIKATALLEFVDFGGLSSGEVSNLIDQRVLTTEQDKLLRAREEAGDAGARAFAPTILNPRTGQPFSTALTGADLAAAAAQFDANTGGFYIAVELTDAGAAAFSTYTASRVGHPMAIVLDSVVLSAPYIRDRLDRRFIIEGDFTQEEASTLALQLRSGSLPIPLREEAVTDVGATLGQQSVDLSIRAGIIGVIVVLAFMVLYYRVPGVAAALALIVFSVLNLAVFKLLPVTLTLPAITGFLISIGTAVDGNILIFERIKEELRGGASLSAALDNGFNRAWGSIRDSNTSTIIICAVLFFFGQTPGASIVSGFAITLILGLIINLFTATIVTRTFLYILAQWLQRPLAERKWLLGA